eukprot:TRINITY_DN35020_c0_g1_i1.p1 TRINITY_DN35020_c0_g1~~TRINITY_DN35020_c0_g1_i1.p1  ORF type:complete len:163 (+),score=23.92 TRINITY_DN35020_c0_g1_i1:87-575(+)
MGCGAISGDKYQVNSLSVLEDEKLKPKSSSSARVDQENEPPVQNASGGNSVEAEKTSKYRPGPPTLEGYEVTEGGSELAKAIAAANDDNILQKYADLSVEGKKRPGATKRVFAPSNGPLSGEPLRINKVSSDHYDSEFVLSNNRVGGLRLQHTSQGLPKVQE